MISGVSSGWGKSPAEIQVLPPHLLRHTTALLRHQEWWLKWSNSNLQKLIGSPSCCQSWILQTFIPLCLSLGNLGNRRRQLWAVWWCFRLPIAPAGDKGRSDLLWPCVVGREVVDRDSPGGRDHIKSPRSLYSYPPLLNTWTLSTEVRFAVPLTLVNDWPTIGSARTTGWRPHSECGDRSPSQRVIVTVTSASPILWRDCHQSWTLIWWGYIKGWKPLICANYTKDCYDFCHNV